MRTKLMLLVAAVTLAIPATAQQAAAQTDNRSLLEQADKYAFDGKLNLARAAYERAIKSGEPLEKDFVRARNLGLCYMNGAPKSFGLAAKWLEIAAQLRPNDQETRLLLAQSLAWGKSYDKSIQQYRTLLASRPDSVEYLLGLANVLYWKGDTNAALTTFEQYLERFPSQVEVRLNYARMLGFSKRYTDALNQYQAVIQSDPNNLTARVGVAKIASWKNQLDISLGLFNKILERQPGYYEAIVGKAYTLFWMGRRDEAKALFTIARNRDPEDKEVAAALRTLSPKPAPEPKLKTAEVAKPEPAQTQPRDERVTAVVLNSAPEVTAVVEAKIEAPVAVPPPPAESMPVQQPVIKADPIPGLLAAAEAAAARANYTEAIHHYHQVLELQPQNTAVQIQIARVLSWSKNYEDSVAQYDALLQNSPTDLFAHTEKARVLSWSKNYDASLKEYKFALTLAEADRPPAVPVRDIRQEYARVLSWAKQNDQSLEQYHLLLPSATQRKAEDIPALVEMARVLAWARRYQESIDTYNQALKLDPGNFEARLGKAQTTYWSGHLAESAAQLNGLLVQRPKNPEASFTLAAVEHGLGNNGRSLGLLRVAPQDSETESLRKSIRSELRPILRFRYGLEDDREIVSVGTDSTTKVLRYTSSIEFNVHPDVRMEILNTTTDALTSNSLLGTHESNAAAMETLARINFRVQPWLRMIAAAGVGQTGGAYLGTIAKTNQHFVYDLHPVITHGSFRTDIAITRHIADYTPLAIDDNVMQQRYSISETYNWKQRVRMGAEYWYAHYTVNAPGSPQLSTNGTGGSLYITPVLYRNERATVDAGVRYDSFTYDSGAEVIANTINSAGFFTPRVYQRISGTAHAAIDPNALVHFEINGTFGPQRIFGFASLLPPPAKFGTTGSLGSQVSLRLGRLTPTFAYDYFSTATPAAAALSNGEYRSNVFSLGLTYRF